MILSIFLSGCTVGRRIRFFNIGDTYDSAEISELIHDSNYNLWDQVIDKEVEINQYKQSPFRFALEFGTVDFAYYLIDHGADMSYQDRDGENEIFYISNWKFRTDFKKFVEKLVENGCNIQVTNREGDTVIEKVVKDAAGNDGLMVRKKIAFLQKMGAPLRREVIPHLEENLKTEYTIIKYLSDELNQLKLEPQNYEEALVLWNWDYLITHAEQWMNSDEEKRRILFHASALGSVENLISILDQSELDVLVEDKDGNSLLTASAAAGNETVFTYLYPLFMQDSAQIDGMQLLIAAIHGENPWILQVVQNDMSTYGKSKMEDLDRKLANAISYSENPDIINWCLNNYKFEQFYLYELGVYLTELDSLKCLEIYLSADQTQEQIGLDEEFSCDVIMECSDPEMVELIFNYVPNSKVKGKCFTTALGLMLSRQTGRIIEDSAGIIQKFYEAGVPLDNAGQGWIPIVEAVDIGDTAAVKKLIELGADLNQKSSKEGRTALMAAAAGDYIIMEELLKAGADPNIKSTEGYTALMVAVNANSKKCTELLIKYGADKSIKNNEDLTAYDIAEKRADKEVIDLLR